MGTDPTRSPGYAERIERHLYSRTDEKEVVARLLREMLGGRRPGHSLDVGAGPGLLSRVLDECSAELTLVEWDRTYEPMLRQTFPHADLRLAPIEDIELPARHYDVILLSHVLYYFPVEHWRPLCQRLLESLRPNGLLVVILNDASGDWWRVVDAFWQRLRRHTRFHFQSPDALRRTLEPLGESRLERYRFVIRYDDVESMATAFGEQLLQITDPQVLADQAEAFRGLARRLSDKNGAPILDATGQVLTVRRD